MIDQQRDYFYCAAHKPIAIPDGFKPGVNLSHAKCEEMGCGERAEVVIFPKPLNYPKLRNA